MLQYCEKEKKVMFIHIVHVFGIDFSTDFKNMLLYEVILTAECFYFVIFPSL